VAETYTYTNDPANSARDRIRIQIGDANVEIGVPILSDQVIDFRLGAESTEALAAWRCCEDIVAALSAKAVDWTTGGQSAKKSQKLEHYRALEKKLRRDASGRNVAFTSGGLSLDEKADNKADPDRTQGTFHADMMRNPKRGSAGQS
jgi:hypothetical protein